MQTLNNSTTSFDETDDILISDYLQKKRSFYRTITRWIAIQGHYLYSYKNKTAPNPTQTIDLKSYTDIIFSNNEQSKYFELVSLDGQTNKRYYIPNNISHAYTIHDWVDTINALLMSPTTPTQELFQRIYNSLGWKSDDALNNFTRKLNKYLNDLWCYRAVDLLDVELSLLNALHVPIDIQTKLFKYIRVWRKQKSFIITEFEQPIPKTKNIIKVLDELVAENKSKQTLDDIKYLKKLFSELCALNIDKIKQYFTKSDWDNVKIPKRLKNILFHKIYRENTYEEKKYESFELNNYKIDPTLTFHELTKLLANSLFVSEQYIKTVLTPFIPYKYDRLYHLCTINDDLYSKLMCNTPKCMRLELYNIIMTCRKQMNGKLFTIPKLKVNLFKIDPTTAIIDILNVSEEKINGYAQFVDLKDNIINKSMESIKLDDNNKYIICKNLMHNKEYKITMQYRNESELLCCSKITSFMTLPTAPILDTNNVNVTHSTITLKLAYPNVECHIEIAAANDITIWKQYIKTNALDFQLISDLNCDSNYKIRARYKNKSGFSSYSDVLTIKTKLPKPPIFSFENITKNSVAIEFNHLIPSCLHCYIKITENNSNKDIISIKTFAVSNVKKFCCDNLKPATTYEIKAYYPKYIKYKSVFTDAVTFETMDWSDCLTKSEGNELKRLIDNYTNNQYKKEWKLLYQGSKHGFTAKSFYNKCDMKQNTICIIRTHENEVFGGFTSLLWDKSKCNSNGKLQKDSNGFMFSIRCNKLCKPVLFPVAQTIRYQSGYYWIFDNERYKIYLKDNCNLNLLSSKTMFECRCYNQPFKVKEIEIYQMFERIRKHNKGYEIRWMNQSINNWTNNDVLHYMTTVCINDYWYYKIISVIKDCNVNGADLMELQSPKEIGAALDITGNAKFCEELFSMIMSFGIESDSSDSVCDDNKSDEAFDQFSINIFHKQRYIVLDEMVSKETKVLYIKKVYKLQTGVKASINDIHFYCRLKEMRNNQRLEDINIIDERHIISVKFGVNAGKN